MGYMMLTFVCVGCGEPTNGNPDKVPSVRVSPGADGKWEPDPEGTPQGICRKCVKTLNASRVKAGMEAIAIAEDAYDTAAVA